MAVYTTHIMLIHGVAKEYNALHKHLTDELKSIAGQSEIIARPGVKGTEYWIKADLTIPDITKAAHAAAKQSGKEYSFTIMKSKGIAIENQLFVG